MYCAEQPVEARALVNVYNQPASLQHKQEILELHALFIKTCTLAAFGCTSLQADTHQNIMIHAINNQRKSQLKKSIFFKSQIVHNSPVSVFYLYLC